MSRYETRNLTKIHKPIIKTLPKFRPILSVINTSGYNITKFLIPILEPLTHNEFTIKDSFNFGKEIRTYDSSLYMATSKTWTRTLYSDPEKPGL